MKHRNLTLIIFVLTLCLSVICLAACEEPFDVKSVSVEQNTFTYDGSAKNLTLKGVPETVKATVTYYTDDTRETEVTNPTNAGAYYAVISFTNVKSNKACGEMTDTLTINKANYTAVDFDINGEYLAEESTATPPQTQSAQPAIEQHGQIYFEIDPNYNRVKVSAANIEVDGNAYQGTPRIRYYSAIKEDGTFDAADSVQSNPVLQNIGDKIYIEVTVSDDNHNAISTYKTVSLERITTYISNYQELCAIYDKINENFTSYENQNNSNLRFNRYVLTADIDCENNIWKVIGSSNYPENTAGFDYDYKEAYFTGEFDGRGHAIKNLKITNDSVKNVMAPNGLVVGLFGYTASAVIHDFTIDNMSIAIDTAATESNNTAYTWNGANPVYAGFVSGLSGTFHGENHYYNINVKNSKMNINAYKAMVGGIIGFDFYNLEYTNVRENLNLENVEIYAINRENSQRVVIGGLAGDIQQATAAVDSDDPNHSYFVPIVYKDCTLTNVKLGYDYASWKAEYDKTQNKDNEFISSEGFTNSFVAAFVGYARSAIVFENCSIENYTIATNGATGYYSYVDAGNGSTKPASSVTLTNCSQVKGNGEYAGIWHDGAEITDGIKWESTPAAE